MKRSKVSEEQVAYALRQAEAGTAVADVCRQLGISEATFYVWKKRYGHLGVGELRRVRQLIGNIAGKSGTFAHFSFHADIAALQLYQPLSDGLSGPDTFYIQPGRPGLVKAFEYPGQYFRRHHPGKTRLLKPVF